MKNFALPNFRRCMSFANCSLQASRFQIFECIRQIIVREGSVIIFHFTIISVWKSHCYNYSCQDRVVLNSSFPNTCVLQLNCSNSRFLEVAISKNTFKTEFCVFWNSYRMSSSPIPRPSIPLYTHLEPTTMILADQLVEYACNLLYVSKKSVWLDIDKYANNLYFVL